MTNNEDKTRRDEVHLFLAFQRNKYAGKTSCVRVVIKHYEVDLAVLEARLLSMGGKWRIHRTVNSRDTEKARLWLIHKLIDFPEGRGFIDSLWKTALLQESHVYGKKKFLLDVDTKTPEAMLWIENNKKSEILERVETPNGFHFVVPAHDTRYFDQCPVPITIIRDGYIFLKEIEENNAKEDKGI